MNNIHTKIGVSLIGLVLLATLMAWISNQFVGAAGWLSFLLVGLLASVIIFGTWHLLKSEHAPQWLLFLIITAGLLRMAAGSLWSIALPVWGHSTPAEMGGYVMGDAAGRDQAAWRLASSEKSLLSAFQDHRKVDQYGGLLFISAAVYRYFGGSTHQPLLIVFLGSALSSLAVIFGWAFSRRIWGKTAAVVSALAIAIYPEAVLVGSSQMREAFTIPLIASAFYGLIRYRDDRSRASLAWILVSFLITLFFSPLSAALLLAGIFLAALTLLRSSLPGKPLPNWLWVLAGLLVLIGLLSVWITLRESVPERITDPVSMITWWLKKSASLQAFLSQHASGWMQKIFKLTPEWSHLPLLLIYGIVQPFLPAALVAGSQAPIWQAIAIWRAIGWTVLLAFLVYAPFHSDKEIENRNLSRMLTLIVWLVILISAFRGGGDLWDNPRYRALFSCLQIALAAKIWVDIRHSNDPWLRRMILLTGTMFAWFIPWYLYRYYGFPWPVSNPFLIMVLGFISGLLLIGADWVRTTTRKSDQIRQLARDSQNKTPGDQSE